MGAIIDFSRHLRRRPRPAAGDDVPTGEILLFTGVRYERRDDAAPADGPPVHPHDGAQGRGRRTSRHA